MRSRPDCAGMAIERLFLRLAVCTLVMSGLAKVAVGLIGGDPFNGGDPLFRLPYRILLPAVGALELLLAGYLLLSSNRLLQYWWLGTFVICAFVYRGALLLVRPGVDCHCLGIVSSWVRPGTPLQARFNAVLIGLLCVLLLGSAIYGFARYFAGTSHGSLPSEEGSR